MNNDTALCLMKFVIRPLVIVIGIIISLIIIKGSIVTIKREFDSVATYTNYTIVTNVTMTNNMAADEWPFVGSR